MFSNISPNSICLENPVSDKDLHSPDTLDLEPFSDFESNFNLSFKVEEPVFSYPTSLSLSTDDQRSEETSNLHQQQEKKRKQKIWDNEEDQRLKYLFEYYHGKWSEIVKNMPQRNASQCQQRWRRINPPKETKHLWTKEIDDKLIQLVSQFGKQWMKIAKCLGNITGKQARDRYINKLDQSISKQPWTHEEDMKILEYFMANGPKWTKVSGLLEGRPENHVKNRFYSYIQRNYLGQQNRYQIIYS